MGRLDGFEYRALGDGNVQIMHNGLKAAQLRGDQAMDFLARVAPLDRAGGQHLMARLTGNYKRGNERQARKHPRNG